MLGPKTLKLRRLVVAFLVLGGVVALVFSGYGSALVMRSPWYQRKLQRQELAKITVLLQPAAEVNWVPQSLYPQVIEDGILCSAVMWDATLYTHPPLPQMEFEQELAKIRTLRLAPEGLQTLTGIDRCVSLQVLDIPVWPDILCSMGGMEEVHFKNEIRDLAPLRGCPQLRRLELAYHSVEDLSPLLELPNLHELDVTGNPLSPRSRWVLIPQLRLRGVVVKY